jgi:hypothetical protein
MSTQIDHIEIAGGPRAINLGPAAAIGVALLVIGLAIGLTVGRLQPGSAEPAAANSAASLAPRRRRPRRSAGRTTTPPATPWPPRRPRYWTSATAALGSCT